jgi:hypothetical protein
MRLKRRVGPGTRGPWGMQEVLPKSGIQRHRGHLCALYAAVCDSDSRQSSTRKAGRSALPE